MVKLNLRDLEALLNGSLRALVQVGLFEPGVTGIRDATDLETTVAWKTRCEIILQSPN